MNCIAYFAHKKVTCIALCNVVLMNNCLHMFSIPVNFAGIEGGFDGAGAKTVIPRKVIGKFSIRLVPDMDPKEIEKLVRTHVEKVHKERNSPNPIKLVQEFCKPSFPSIIIF
eukprot:GHVU01030442.1.p1 GENE.GHVU01030442.1~~GHVU01030442.1.p1  ORF type:complete len:112 (+),score=7.80 GHVU01030442.1:665-1000(+)